MSEEKEIDCDFTDEIVCPYCGYEFSDSNELDSLSDEKSCEVQCEECEKSFSCCIDIKVSYSSRKVPCMNNEEPHEFKDVNSFDKEGWYKYHAWHCRKCDKEEMRPNPNYKPEHPKC